MSGDLGRTPHAAHLLNEQCWCVGTDLPGLRETLDELLAAAGVTGSIQGSHPHLFAGVPVFIAEVQHQRIVESVRAIHRVVALPGWQAAVMADASPAAQHASGNTGSFLGVDFHLGSATATGDDGALLIEINTNPGGALLNVLLGRAQQACCKSVANAFPDLQNFDAAEARLMAVFASEWRSAGRSGLPTHLVICDEAPHEQYLYPEFLLYQQLLRRLAPDQALRVSIADPRALSYSAGQLWLDGTPVDMVYNRLTDFALRADHLTPLRQAWLDAAIVLTPHPRAHALYANKRNLVRLADASWLGSIGVDAPTRAVLAATVPESQLVCADQAESLWVARKQFFFKPLEGFGSRGTYRGDKLTRKVFAEILAGGYVAQHVAPPTERVVSVDGAQPTLKLDLRAFSYEGEVFLLAARLYRGQTTNFRTEGGGFAPVLRAEAGCGCVGEAGD